MSDGAQVVIVTLVAAAALVTLVRPYLRRPDRRHPGPSAAPPCANCAASSTGPGVRTAGGVRESRQ